MDLGIIGLGKMGGNMRERLRRRGHCGCCSQSGGDPWGGAGHTNYSGGGRRYEVWPRGRTFRAAETLGMKNPEALEVLVLEPCKKV